MDFNKKVALLILNYNSKEFIQTALDSLLAQSYTNFEIFAIDNDSSDGGVQYIKKHYPKNKFPNINLVEHKNNYGYGKGVNKVIKQVYKKFEYVALIDPDIRLDKNWLEELVGTMENHLDSQICSCLTLDWEGNVIDNAGGVIVNIFAGIFTGFMGDLPVTQIPENYKNAEFPIIFGVATAMLVRSKAFEKYGFCDEDYFLYFEDFDLSWRIALGGGLNLCNTKAKAFHFGHGSKTSKNIQTKILKQTEINLFATYTKNFTLISLMDLLPPLLMARLIMSLIYIPISPKITTAKIIGIVTFLKNISSGKYSNQRKFISQIRIISDRELLSRNPISIFSIKPVLTKLLPWFHTINTSFSRSNG
jgi:GT2 family glycosyltransferase